MSSLKIQGNASGTGSVTLVTPNINTNRSQNIPDTDGTLMIMDSFGGIFNSAGVINFGAGQLYKDASGNLGLGVTPSAWVSSVKTLELANGVNFAASTSSATLFATTNAYYDTAWRYKISNYASRYEQDSGQHRWFTAPSGTAGNVITFTQAMTLDANGKLQVGTVGPTFSSEQFTVLNPANNNNPAMAFNAYSRGMGGILRAASGTYVEWYCAGTSTTTGSITTNGTTTAYNTSSDYRLKEDVQPMTGALARVAALKPCTYKWKANGGEGEGFIAHELAEVVPDAVTGEKDAVDAEGNPVYQGIDTSFLVATLTAAIQEQQAIIEQLTARISALEAK